MGLDHTAFQEPPEPTLAEVSTRHPEWEIHKVWGAFVAVPKGSPFVQKSWLSSLDAMLAEL
jgi:hypothetical protein